eukprot:1192067-Prorocentrum_minimum.AAC.3
MIVVAQSGEVEARWYGARRRYCAPLLTLLRRLARLLPGRRGRVVDVAAAGVRRRVHRCRVHGRGVARAPGTLHARALRERAQLVLLLLLLLHHELLLDLGAHLHRLARLLLRHVQRLGELREVVVDLRLLQVAPIRREALV